VEIALPDVLAFCDGASLCAGLCTCRSWRSTLCFLNASQQQLFQRACLQSWPWLEGTLHWSHCGHHLWHHYFGNWQALYCDSNRANSVCCLELEVPLDDTSSCIQGKWVTFPERPFSLRINAYPAGNRLMTMTHLSAYLEVRRPDASREVQKMGWHAALDFTFTMQYSRRSQPVREVSWSSGPVRFMENPFGSSRLDWGCHELLPMDIVRSETAHLQAADVDNEKPAASVKIRAQVAMQEALVEVVSMDWLTHHRDDFGMCVFSTFEANKCRGSGREVEGADPSPIRLTVPASTTKAELLQQVSAALGHPVTHLWRFSRSIEAHGRLACNLPEAPRHLLTSAPEDFTWSQDRGDEAIYALLTKWTLGESSGGARQNFFRVLAEDRTSKHGLVPGPPTYTGPSSTVFVKYFNVGAPLQIEGFVTVPWTEVVAQLLPAILTAVRAKRVLREIPILSSWTLVREGSPCDWLDGQVCCGGDLLNGQGPVVDGDVLVLCPREAVLELAALYRRQYEQRVAEFTALHRRETALVGSVKFSEICQVMDSLNVDVWRLEQFMGTGHSARPALSLMSALPGLHPQFFCDACGNRELRGCRFNCLLCSDFDLCERCYNSQPELERQKDHNGRNHERSHQMVKIHPALPEDCLRTNESAGLQQSKQRLAEEQAGRHQEAMLWGTPLDV